MQPLNLAAQASDDAKDPSASFGMFWTQVDYLYGPKGTFKMFSYSPITIFKNGASSKLKL